MAVYRDHQRDSSSKNYIFFGIATSISKEFKRISTIVSSYHIPDRLYLFQGRLERIISLPVSIAGRLRSFRIYSRDTTMIGVILLFLACVFAYGAIHRIFCSPGRDEGSENYSNYSSGRTTLYCETCYRSRDIDSTGWCHNCERISPLGIFLFADYVTNTIPGRDFY